jgi:hypothetical protein
MTARLLVAALIATASLPVAAQEVSTSPQAARAAQCLKERAELTLEGWDMTNVYLTCESNVTHPVRVREVRPRYTQDGLAAKRPGEHRRNR